MTKNLENGVTGLPAGFAFLAPLLGALQCFFGFRWFRIVTAITGSFLGCVLGLLLGAAMTASAAISVTLTPVFGVLGGFGI